MTLVLFPENDFQEIERRVPVGAACSPRGDEALIGQIRIRAGIVNQDRLDMPPPEGEHEVEVLAAGGLGEFRRIEPATVGQLARGMKLIVDGVHYLHDGDSINAFDEVEVSP